LAFYCAHGLELLFGLNTVLIHELEYLEAGLHKSQLWDNCLVICFAF